MEDNDKNVELTFWEIVVVVHTFVGTFFIESLSMKMFSSGVGLLYFTGILIFLENLFLLLTAYNWKEKRFYNFKFKRNDTTTTVGALNVYMILSMVDIVIFILIKLTTG